MNGDFDLRRDLKQKARKLRKDATCPERVIWGRILSNRKLNNNKFLRQKPIGKFIVDFYCAELKLVIEIDGDTHDAGNDKDAERTAILTQLGLKVIRYCNTDIMNNLDGVYLDLLCQIDTRGSELKNITSGKLPSNA
jgi:very-short-patch-repair endonuclease